MLDDSVTDSPDSSDNSSKENSWDEEEIGELTEFKSKFTGKGGTNIQCIQKDTLTRVCCTGWEEHEVKKFGAIIRGQRDGIKKAK